MDTALSSNPARNNARAAFSAASKVSKRAATIKDIISSRLVDRARTGQRLAARLGIRPRCARRRRILNGRIAYGLDRRIIIGRGTRDIMQICHTGSSRFVRPDGADVSYTLNRTEAAASSVASGP